MVIKGKHHLYNNQSGLKNEHVLNLKERGYQKRKAGIEKLRKFMFTYIVNDLFIFNLKFIFFSASSKTVYFNYTTSNV